MGTPLNVCFNSLNYLVSRGGWLNGTALFHGFSEDMSDEARLEYYEDRTHEAFGDFKLSDRLEKYESELIKRKHAMEERKMHDRLRDAVVERVEKKGERFLVHLSNGVSFSLDKL